MMNRRGPLVVVMAVAILSATVGIQETQAKRPHMSKPEILENLKPGQWVQLEGMVQRDMTALCSEVKFLTGDFVDDDWEVSGIVQSVNALDGELKIMKLPVKPRKDAEYSNKTGTFKSFADLRPGMMVELEGTYLKDGNFLAKEIEDESAKLSVEPNLKNEIQLTGRVQTVDKTKGIVTVMGLAFQLTDLTKGKSAMK